MIVTGNRQLLDCYHQLAAGDVFVGRIALKYLRAALLVDLLEQGVQCLPPALSQILSGSKIAQAFVLSKWMLPHTTVITRRQALLQAVNHYHRLGIAAVVTKQDHMHCGHGLRRWQDLELLYNALGFCEDAYPFVLQPYFENYKDVRVIVAGDYIEGYLRYNPNNFRMNLAAGGSSSSHVVDAELEGFCRSVMARGRFPYAHLDVLLTEDGCCWLSEISLEAGIKGAKISRQQLEQTKRQVLEGLLTHKRDERRV